MTLSEEIEQNTKELEALQQAVKAKKIEMSKRVSKLVRESGIRYSLLLDLLPIKQSALSAFVNDKSVINIKHLPIIIEATEAYIDAMNKLKAMKR